jgi:hypothetical protein
MLSKMSKVKVVKSLMDIHRRLSRVWECMEDGQPRVEVIRAMQAADAAMLSFIEAEFAVVVPEEGKLAAA